MGNTLCCPPKAGEMEHPSQVFKRKDSMKEMKENFKLPSSKELKTKEAEQITLLQTQTK